MRFRGSNNMLGIVDACNEAIDIVRALAGADPPISEYIGLYCVLCNTDIESDVKNPDNHCETCSWRKAREWVDNEYHKNALGEPE